MKRKNVFKTLIYGTIPYLYCRLFNQTAENLEYYRLIHRQGYASHLYECSEEYETMHVEVMRDDLSSLPYVINRQGRKLYFKRQLSLEKVERMYKALALEQDSRSPHHYLDGTEEMKGRIFVDVGCAEGYTSLEVVEEATHLYLFESDAEWIEALKTTFAPWKEKVTIVPKWVGNEDNEQMVQLDSFFRQERVTRLFLKMDIEGNERNALMGCRELFTRHDVRFAICTYHHNDEKIVPPLLLQYGARFKAQYGYFRHKRRIVVVKGKTE